MIVLVALLLLLAGKAYYDTNCIEVGHYQIKSFPLGEILGGLKVALLSDLHMKRSGLMVDKILEILNREKPDLIFVTGDFIGFEGPYEPVMSFFEQLKPPYGVYGVLGNTEYSNENGSCILCHDENSRSLKKNQHPILLRNSIHPLKINGRVLNIIGVDDPVNKRSDLEAVLKTIHSQGPSILLSHSPEIFEEASNSGIDLMLSGHTHGGQIFLVKYLRKIIPLEKSLTFIEGFFQNGRMLAYVNRGVGTSFLPFRFGVKPEITLFTFAAPQHSSTVAHPFWSISNNPPNTIFTGLSLSNLIETFNVLKIFESLGLTSGLQQHRSTVAEQTLFDFESEEELKRLNWECHKWFELSDENVTSGKHSLKVILPPGKYPGINFNEIRSDWSEFGYLKMDIFNPSPERFDFHIRIDDSHSGVEYADRYDIDFKLQQGLNQVSIPIDSIRTNLHHQPLNLKRIKRMMVFLINSTKQRDLYLDHIRLE